MSDFSEEVWSGLRLVAFFLLLITSLVSFGFFLTSNDLEDAIMAIYSLLLIILLVVLDYRSSDQNEEDKVPPL